MISSAAAHCCFVLCKDLRGMSVVLPMCGQSGAVVMCLQADCPDAGYGGKSRGPRGDGRFRQRLAAAAVVEGCAISVHAGMQQKPVFVRIPVALHSVPIGSFAPSHNQSLVIYHRISKRDIQFGWRGTPTLWITKSWPDILSSTSTSSTSAICMTRTMAISMPSMPSCSRY